MKYSSLQGKEVELTVAGLGMVWGMTDKEYRLVLELVEC